MHGDQLFRYHGVGVIVTSAKFNQQVVSSHPGIHITAPGGREGAWQVGVVNRGRVSGGGATYTGLMLMMPGCLGSSDSRIILDAGKRK